MSQRHEEWARRFRIAWNGTRGAEWLATIGKLLGDSMEEGGVYALRQGMPEYAESSNVHVLAAERGIEVGPLTTTTTEARVTRAARSINRFRGTPLGLLLALYYADFLDTPTGAVLITQNGLAWYIGTGFNLDDLEDAETAAPSWLTKTSRANNNPALPASTDGRPAVPAFTVPWYSLTGGPMDADGNQFTSRFAVLFPFGLQAGAELSTAANLARIRRIIREWKPAKTTCVGIYVSTSGFSWGWGAEWGDGSQWGGSPTVFYSAS